MKYRHREAPAHQANHPVPVQPVLAVVERWIAENAAESGWTTNGRTGMLRPERQLAQVMGLKWTTVARQLYRMRHESQHLTLVNADRYVDATYGHRLWAVDHELAEELAAYGLPCLAVPTGDNSWMRPEEQVDGEWGIRHWAWTQVKAMSREERRQVAVGLERFETEDHSRSARKVGLGANRRLAA